MPAILSYNLLANTGPKYGLAELSNRINPPLFTTNQALNQPFFKQSMRPVPTHTLHTHLPTSNHIMPK